jgi:hypothetical protein
MAVYTHQKDRVVTAKYNSGPCFNSAAYDSLLMPKPGGNAELTLTLKIKFTPLDPDVHGSDIKDAGGDEYAIRKWDFNELVRYKREALRQANETWNKGLCLIPPHDFDIFDYPVGSIQYRPNVKCVLNCIESPLFHAEVKLARLKYDRGFPVPILSILSPKRDSGAFRSNSILWDNFDIGVRFDPVDQPNSEDIEHWTVPHEVGHLLGLQHIGAVQRLRSCVEAKKTSKSEPSRCYADAKDAPMWMARDIMGVGKVVHACNASPWLDVIEYHTGCDADRWLPAGVEISPRKVADIPTTDFTQANSPYQGGYQEVGSFKKTRGVW